jgi:hypothetical protein
MVSYWRNNRDRILSQLTVWDSEKSVSDEQESSHSGTAEDKCIGAILPQVLFIRIAFCQIQMIALLEPKSIVIYR